MTDSNLVQLAFIEENTWGITPSNPAMRILRYTGEDLEYQINTVESAEIITDRQITDLIQTNARNVGGYKFELSYKEHDEFAAGALMSSWVLSPEKDNNGTADTIVTQVTDSSDTYSIASGGAAFVVGHLVRASGFTNAANNQIFRVVSSTDTTVVGTTLTLVDEASPPGTARLKVVGFQGISGDITATATGLGSSTLTFTTLGLRVGQYIKIGGTASVDRFATSALNDWVRVTAVAAHAITCDNRPTGWTTDSGGSKTIKVWVADGLSNGVTLRSWTIEKGFLGQTIPYYLPFQGLTMNNMTLDIVPARPVNGTFTMLGKSVAAASTSALDASPDASHTGSVINAVNNVGRIAEGGVTVTSPNYVQQITMTTTNNLRERTAVGVLGLTSVGTGQFRVTGKLTTYFGDAAIYNKLVNNTETSISVRFERSNQAYIIQLPRVKLSGGTPQAGGANQDVVIAADYTALKDTALTNKTMIIDRFEYFES